MRPRFTGWDDDGGYAELAVVPEAYAYALPDEFDDATAAPLLCAGIIGFRALERARLPEGGVLGIYGFGGSAHLAAQIALHRGHRVHVLTRSESARRLALELGCASAAAADAPVRDSPRLKRRAPSRGLPISSQEENDRGAIACRTRIHASATPCPALRTCQPSLCRKPALR